MRTNKLIKKIKKLGFDVDNGASQLVVLSDDGIKVVAVVKKNTLYSVDTNHVYFDKLDVDDRGELFVLLMDYANTPIDERGNFKYRYRIGDDLIVSYPVPQDIEHRYELYESDTVPKNGKFKLSFTDKEFKEFPLWVQQLYYRGYLTKEEV